MRTGGFCGEVYIPNAEILRRNTMSEAHAKKHRRMLYQAVLIALPVALNEVAYAMSTYVDIPGAYWVFLIGWNWVISGNAFVYLAFNTKLRQDALKIFPKSVQHLLGIQSKNHVVPTAKQP